MNKKILLGSIIAVIILVLVSFTGVVGYQTTKSSTIARASPLFKVRSTRAINQESKDIACDYVGKGEESILSIPKRDNKIETIQKFMDIIKSLDGKAFNYFVELVIFHLEMNKKNVDVKIKDAFHFIRENPQKIKSLATNEIRVDTLESPCTIGGKWRLACYLVWIIEVIGAMLGLILLSLSLILGILIPTSMISCPTSYCKQCNTLQL